MAAPTSGQASIIPASDAAAFITTFLLAAGLSSEYLSKWVSYRLLQASPAITLNDFMQQLIHQYETGYGRSEIMVVLDQSVAPIARAVDGWLSRREVDLWFQQNGFTPPKGVHGGILYVADQWDIYGALQDVSSALRRISYRTSLKFDKSPVFNRLAWIKGVESPRRIPSLSNFKPAYRDTKWKRQAWFRRHIWQEPLCRHHHRCKQSDGWWLEQPEPGVLKWRTPGGRTYATTPTAYPLG
jgi:hypothetical protein